MRIVFVKDAGRLRQGHGEGRCCASVGILAAARDMRWSLRADQERQRVLMLVWRFNHYLDDLLYRTRIGELNMEICGIVSNHPTTPLRFLI